MKAYSVDLRARVVAAVERGMPRRQAVTVFGVSPATLKRWLAQQRTTGSLIPARPPGRQRRIAAERQAALRAQLAAYPDATIAWHTQRWNAAQGTDLSQWTVGRAIPRLGWTRKKRRLGPPNATSSTGRPIGSGSGSGT